MLRYQCSPHHVHSEDALPILNRRSFHGGGSEVRGIVDENIDGAESINDLFHHFVDVARLRDVTKH